MKKIKQSFLFVVASFIVFFGFSSIAAAETVSEDDSDANIEFKSGDGSSEVVDPEDPDKSFDPDPDKGDPEDDPTGDTGSLTLDYVSSIEFGTHEVSGEHEVYEAETLRPFIQVTDRRGTAKGWSVTAQSSAFTNDEDDDGEETLSGAVLTLKNGEVSSTSNADEPSPVSTVELKPGEDATAVVNAEEDEGMGKWITRWLSSDDEELNDNVTLEVPNGSATKGKHTATINWTLADAPQ